MIKKVSFAIVLILAGFTLRGQTLTGNYIVELTGGIGGDGQLTEKAKIPDTYAYTYSKNTSSFILLTNKNTSSETIKKKDAVYNTEYETVETTTGYSGYRLVKHLAKGKYEKVYTIEGVETFIKDGLPELTWVITNEKKTIDGFTCTKATTEHKSFGIALKVTAWFSDEIPVKDGPFEFGGLPGFVLELSTENLFIVKFTGYNYDKTHSTDIETLTSDVPPQTVKELESQWKWKG